MHSEGTAQLPPVAPGIFTTGQEGEGSSLLGGACPACDRDFFPRPSRCPLCLGAIDEKNLGSTGKLYTFTVVRVKPSWGLPCPYGVGYVDLDGSGLRVLGLLDPESLDRLEIGLPLRLAVGEMGVDLRGNPCLRPFFQPAEEGAHE